MKDESKKVAEKVIFEGGERYGLVGTGLKPVPTSPYPAKKLVFPGAREGSASTPPER
jgi:hypothetical protein